MYNVERHGTFPARTDPGVAPTTARCTIVRRSVGQEVPRPPPAQRGHHHDEDGGDVMDAMMGEVTGSSLARALDDGEAQA
jgi:hypothetical protein